jgi:hypothetical protein
MVDDFDEFLLEIEWRKCRVPDWDKATLEEKASAFEYFCRNYWYIRHPKGKRLFDLYDAQAETIRIWLAERYSVALKARQIGFSTLIAAYAFWLTFFFDDRVIIMISKTERHSAKLLGHSKYGYRFMPKWMQQRGPILETKTQTKMAFTNESSIESLPSASEPGRGDTAFLAIIDEIGFLPNSEEAYAAVEPVAEVGGSLIMLGTANGEGNLLHKLWLGSQGLGSEYSQYKGIFHGWWASGRTQDWYDHKSDITPAWQMAQEYPDNPEEAFLKSGRPVFDLDVVRAIPTAPPILRGTLWEKPGEGIVLRDHDNGALRVWSPPQPKRRYVIGADVAEGLEHGDFSCAQVIDVATGHVVAIWHGHVDADLFGSDVLNLLGRWYNVALLGVEINNHGLTTAKALQRASYRNLYYQVRLGQKWEAKTENLGWRTSAVSKPYMIDELAKALRGGPAVDEWDEELGEFIADPDKSPRGPDALVVPDAETIAELKTYTRDEKGRTSGSPHDDRTMALAIAVEMIKHSYLPQYRVKDEPGPGTMGFLEKMLYAEEKKKPNAMGAFCVRANGRGTVSPFRR